MRRIVLRPVRPLFGSLDRGLAVGLLENDYGELAPATFRPVTSGQLYTVCGKVVCNRWGEVAVRAKPLRIRYGMSSYSNDLRDCSPQRRPLKKKKRFYMQSGWSTFTCQIVAHSQLGV